MNNYWLDISLEKRKKDGYWEKHVNYSRLPGESEFGWHKRKFKVGDKVICANTDESPRGQLLEVGKIYTVTMTSYYHYMSCIYVDDIGWRYMESKFDFAE